MITTTIRQCLIRNVNPDNWTKTLSDPDNPNIITCTNEDYSSDSSWRGKRTYLKHNDVFFENNRNFKFTD